MLKVWVGLEARKFLQASAESVSFPECKPRSLHGSEKLCPVKFLAFANQIGSCETDHEGHVYRWNDVSNTISYRQICRPPLHKNPNLVPFSPLLEGINTEAGFLGWMLVFPFPRFCSYKLSFHGRGSPIRLPLHCILVNPNIHIQGSSFYSFREFGIRRLARPLRAYSSMYITYHPHHFCCRVGGTKIKQIPTPAFFFFLLSLFSQLERGSFRFWGVFFQKMAREGIHTTQMPLLLEFYFFYN